MNILRGEKPEVEKKTCGGKDFVGDRPVVDKTGGSENTGKLRRKKNNRVKMTEEMTMWKRSGRNYRSQNK